MRRRCKPEASEASEANANEWNIGEKGISFFVHFSAWAEESMRRHSTRSGKLPPEGWWTRPRKETKVGDLCAVAIL